MIEIVSASPVHIGPIATRMREIDRRECEAFGRSGKASLRLGLAGSSVALTALVDGRPEAMFGVVPVSVLSGEGQAWMLGTEAVTRHARALIGLGPSLLDRFHQVARRLSNWVAADNRPALLLLRHWGFEVGSESRDIGGLAFLPFWRERSV